MKFAKAKAVHILETKARCFKLQLTLVLANPEGTEQFSSL